MKNPIKKKLLMIGLILLFILIGVGFTITYVLRDKINLDSSSSVNSLSILTPQNISFKIQEESQGQKPSQKLDEIYKAIKEKNLKSFESIYSIVNLGHIGLYEGVIYEKAGTVDQNSLRQREYIKNLLWSEYITSYKILDSKFYNQPCCSVGWIETINQDWIGMARYVVEFTTNDSKKLKYNIEITVSNPDWLMPGEQVEIRKWVITNISDKDLPELYKGF